ncbi:MAG: DUF5722 domain-containing protein [Lachnospiraceae bacterium]
MKLIKNKSNCGNTGIIRRVLVLVAAVVWMLPVSFSSYPVYGEKIQQEQTGDTTKNSSDYYDAGSGESTNYYRVEPRTKKGLQEAFSYSGVYADLGVSHTLINICLNKVLGGSNPYVYHGKTYYFDDVPNLSVDTVREFNENNVCVTVVLLLQRDDQSVKENLLHPGGNSNKGKLYYGWNVDDAKAMETMNALLDYLAFTYGQEDCHVDNWIVGNEVNMPNTWNYIGTTDLSTNVDVAAKSLVMVDNAIKRYNSGARAYLSLDRSWTHNDEGRGIAGKEFLDAFAVRMKELAPKVNWNLAYHPYASIMTDSNIWNSKNAYYYTPVSEEADFISARNLNILTDYVKDHFGENVRIILSEQGFTVYNGQEAKQAAALAYTYYAAEFNDMIDATMFRSLKDASVEMKDHFYFGLLNSDGSKRPSYDVFKYMDTQEWETYTKGCLNTIGISLWNELVTYFDGERFKLKPLEELNLEKDGVVLAVGYRDKLDYTVYPEFASTKGLKWISDDNRVVTIDANSGEMTGVGAGRTIVRAVCDDTEYASCIVVVKDADESRVNVENFINELYERVTGTKASDEDRLSYRERLMDHHMTAAQVVYEVIGGKEANQPSETDEEYVRLLYRAMLGMEDEEIDTAEVEKYVTCLEAGMSRDRVFVDIISMTEFDYRCYDYDIDTGSAGDIRAFRNLNRTSYNRNSDVTYYVARTIERMLGRTPQEEELKALCSGLLSSKVSEGDILETIFESEEFQKKEISDEEFLDMLYDVTGIETGNSLARGVWLRLMENNAVERETVVKEFAEHFASKDK